MDELEDLVIAENDEYSKRVLESRKKLEALPPKKVGKDEYKWCRCITVCVECGCEEGYASVRETNLWCVKCGKTTLYVPKYRIER